MAQFGRPISNITIPTGWSGSYTDIDEAVPNNTDFVQGTRNGECKFGITSLTDPAVDTGHYMRCTAVIATGGMPPPPQSSKLRLHQGASLIYEADITVTTTYQTFEVLIPTSNVANITDYTNLRLHVMGMTGFGATFKLDQLELEIPDAAGGGGISTKRIFLIT